MDEERHIPLPLKYRPNNFAELIGQDACLRTRPTLLNICILPFARRELGRLAYATRNLTRHTLQRHRGVKKVALATATHTFFWGTKAKSLKDNGDEQVPKEKDARDDVRDEIKYAHVAGRARHISR